MKIKKTLPFLLLFFLASCAEKIPEETTPSSVQIFLYGEVHGSESLYDKEFALWSGYYRDMEYRHLFVELPYYTAEFLNMWMKADSDEILDAVYTDLEGTQSHVPALKEFYKRIKKECPETVFHGTDIGHQYHTTGERYLAYLKENGMEETDEYATAREAIAQGEDYYKRGDYVYREDKMTENFIREFDKLNGESVMGIYGSAHVPLAGFAYTSNSHPGMANQLRERYGVNVHSEDLTTETLIVGGKEYMAQYFGEQDISSLELDYTKRAFWRLEDAFGDFADNPKTGYTLPYDNYPMPIETAQVFVIDYTKSDGIVDRVYYRSDGNEWNGRPTTEQFTIE